MRRVLFLKPVIVGVSHVFWDDYGIVYHDPYFGGNALIEMEIVGFDYSVSKPYREEYGASRGGFPYW